MTYAAEDKQVCEGINVAYIENSPQGKVVRITIDLTDTLNDTTGGTFTSPITASALEVAIIDWSRWPGNLQVTRYPHTGGSDPYIFTTFIPIDTYVSWLYGKSEFPWLEMHFAGQDGAKIEKVGGGDCSQQFNIPIPDTVAAPNSCGGYRNGVGGTQNHFSCARNVNTGAWTVGETSCKTGFEPDHELCTNNSGTTGASCLPCREIKPEGTKNHGEACTDTSECKTSQGLTCRTLARDSSKKVCLYQEKTRQRTGSCVVGSNECIENMLSGGTTWIGVICGASTSEFRDNVGSISSCKAVSEVANLSCSLEGGSQQAVGDGICTSKLGVAATCFNGFCAPAEARNSPSPVPGQGNPGETPGGGNPGDPGGGTTYNPPPFKIGGVYCDTNGDGNVRNIQTGIPEGVWTGLGCIPASLGGLFKAIFGVAIGIAGGIAFVLIIFGGLKIIASAGNPEAMNEGKELVTAAITGLLLIIFSVFLLRFVGVSILSIPGFS